MTDNHTELCERLRTENSCDEGFYEHCTEAADLIESQAARIAELQRELETARQERNAAGVKARRELMPAYEARIAELEKERDALIHDNARLLKAARAEETLASEALAERDELKVDAERYEYLLDCEVEAARRYLPSLDADEFKNARRARHSAALQAEKETRS